MQSSVRLHRAAESFLSTTTLLPSVTNHEVSVDGRRSGRSRRCARVTHTGPRHPSLPSAEAGRAAAGTRDRGLPRSCGVRSRRFQPFLTVMYHNLVLRSYGRTAVENYGSPTYTH